MKNPLARLAAVVSELYDDPTSTYRWIEVVVAAVRRPAHGAKWLHARLRNRSPLELGLPWLSWPCVDYLRRHIRPEMRVFEWGGGGSTIFFAEAGCRVVTVEPNAHWRDLISARLTAGGHASARTEIRPIQASENGDGPTSAYVNAVHDGGPWDLILIDGAFRLDCLRAAKDALSPGGVLLFDNADFEEFYEAPRLVPEFQRIGLRGLGVGSRRWVTRTDLYRRDD